MEKQKIRKDLSLTVFIDLCSLVSLICKRKLRKKLMYTKQRQAKQMPSLSEKRYGKEWHLSL